MEQMIYTEMVNRDERSAVELLKSNPNVNVNWQNLNGWTLLHRACYCGYDGVIALLLAYHDIDVNLKNIGEETPFLLACYWGKVSAVRLLLQDKRVNLSTFDKAHNSALWYAVIVKEADAIKWWIVLTEDTNLGIMRSSVTAVIQRARNQGSYKEISLLDKFYKQPAQTRFQLKLELGFRTELVADFFATIVFLSDDLLDIKRLNNTANTDRKSKQHKSVKFLNVSRRLPMELQMLLCHRVFGSTKHNVTSTESEAAFRRLAKVQQY